jgi:two-component system NtrC family sensor kinase
VHGRKGWDLRFTDLKDSKILIVDDQVNNLRALAAVLDFAGCENVKCLSDSREAVPTFVQFQPDLLLLDLHMPHLDGVAVMDQLRAVISKDDYLPILVLTGDSSAEAKENALSHGASDFLSKPLNQTEVELRVKNLLQTRWLHREMKAQNVSLEKQVRETTTLAEQLAETNQRLREAQGHLVQSEKMASLGQLVAGIAHEINNPLAFVINNIFVVQEELAKAAAEVPIAGSISLSVIHKMRKRVDHMQEGAERVKDLVTKLRTFSRLDEGKLKTVDIHESIESVLLFLRHKMEDRINVERHFTASEPLTCFAGELNQVLMNVIGNAIDSIEGEGTIRLFTGQEDGQFLISIRDTGKGIPNEIRNRVFEPFFTTKPLGSGTGLGLAISYGIVKAHHGSIEFSSEEGTGTEFIVKIPNSYAEVSQ